MSKLVASIPAEVDAIKTEMGDCASSAESTPSSIDECVLKTLREIEHFQLDKLVFQLEGEQTCGFLRLLSKRWVQLQRSIIPYHK